MISCTEILEGSADIAFVLSANGQQSRRSEHLFVSRLYMRRGKAEAVRHRMPINGNQ